MKKLFTIIIVMVMLISITSCDGVGNTSDTEETTIATTISTSLSEIATEETAVTISETTDTETSTGIFEITPEELPYKLDISYFGKTFNEMIEKYPELIIVEGRDMPTSDDCSVKMPDKEIYYGFYSSQFGPPLTEASIEYGDEIRVSSVTATVGDVFTETSDNMPLDEFLASIGITEFRYYYFDDNNANIFFHYGDMICDIDTFNNKEIAEYGELRTINRDFWIRYMLFEQ